MSKTIEAVYEDGVFRPLSQVKGLKKHQKVSITLQKPIRKKHPLEGLCGILPDKDAAEMLKAVEEEFEKVDINEW
ncbi:MAG TPA: antitoxin family protein [Thermodesulfovibrionales bacterium]|nr:antitoxin family protein [Thermodesulfovibrionales bacterium]